MCGGCCRVHRGNLGMGVPDGTPVVCACRRQGARGIGGTLLGTRLSIHLWCTCTFCLFLCHSMEVDRPGPPSPTPSHFARSMYIPFIFFWLFVRQKAVFVGYAAGCFSVVPRNCFVLLCYRCLLFDARVQVGGRSWRVVGCVVCLCASISCSLCVRVCLCACVCVFEPRYMNSVPPFYDLV